VDTALLTGIATATGGQYFSVSTAEDLPDVFRTISEEIEPTDTDGDGIPDITETTGFRDGLSDSEDEYLLSPASIEPESSTLEIGRSIVPGAVFGECGIEGGSPAPCIFSFIFCTEFFGLKLLKFPYFLSNF
jgi:hypothetical protein